ncbi:hypothetical protein E3O19_00715 [Cryobacterium algoritolerans]|uniref:Uncharacterized protein n=1 Tax=Cryobacterium algoritolerans TaxID=1259184 RepID=A0A4V3IFG0_9MICO|nr:hypothetical protein [Cryobacterium algoritolerans]TFC20994.1 hypothetical protein E3O19_00715 [Cryobacterium algoritolerans]
MTDPTPHAHLATRSREEDQHVLAAGNETGWWDDNGRPATWPDDSLDPEAGWTNGNTDTPKNRPF